MTLFQHTLGALLRGEKTETSRLALPEPDGETMIGTEMICYPSGIKSVCQGREMRWIPKWQVGKDYAIQPARGVKSIGRYRIENIWKQDVRTLSDAQVKAEGFRHTLNRTDRVAFFRLWTVMHDPNIAGQFERRSSLRMLDDRPDERYTAWRMQISVMYETIDWNAVPHEALPPWRKWTTITLNDGLQS